jgi:hypothetical protein
MCAYSASIAAGSLPPTLPRVRPWVAARTRYRRCTWHWILFSPRSTPCSIRCQPSSRAGKVEGLASGRPHLSALDSTPHGAQTAQASPAGLPPTGRALHLGRFPPWQTPRPKCFGPPKPILTTWLVTHQLCLVIAGPPCWRPCRLGPGLRLPTVRPATDLAPWRWSSIRGDDR